MQRSIGWQIRSRTSDELPAAIAGASGRKCQQQCGHSGKRRYRWQQRQPHPDLSRGASHPPQRRIRHADEHDEQCDTRNNDDDNDTLVSSIHQPQRLCQRLSPRFLEFRVRSNIEPAFVFRECQSMSVWSVSFIGHAQLVRVGCKASADGLDADEDDASNADDEESCDGARQGTQLAGALGSELASSCAAAQDVSACILVRIHPRFC